MTVPAETLDRLCEDRVVVVTGAGRGVGRAHALEFAKQGAKVVVNDLGSASDGSGRSDSPAQQVVDEIRAAGGIATVDANDISMWDGAQALIDHAIEEYGRLDVLVNNAGILRDRTIVRMTEEEWDDVVRVHLKGTFATTHGAARHWRDRSKDGDDVQGRLINTSSSSGLYGAPGQVNYAAAKAGVASLTIVASRELARYGATANCIYPTANSRLTEELFRSRGLVGDSGDLVDEAARLDPSNVAPLVVWLGSVESESVTGRVFGVRGNRIVLADGWAAGERVESEDPWDPATIGPMILELHQRARPNAGTNGEVPGGDDQ